MNNTLLNFYTDMLERNYKLKIKIILDTNENQELLKGFKEEIENNIIYLEQIISDIKNNKK